MNLESYQSFKDALLVAVIVMIILISIELIDSEKSCLNDIALKYPSASCGYGQYLYCEWNNKTYTVIQHISKGQDSYCDFEVKE